LREGASGGQGMQGLRRRGVGGGDVLLFR
jgi:hypothetical protein